jgi:cytoskeletal protein CcmA (bactofilin family)
MRSRSDRVFGVTIVGLLLAVPMLLGAVRVTGQVILPEGEHITEDLYAFAERIVIDGVIEGDLLAVTGELIINGVVQGDVLGLVGGPVRINGTVEGSVRVAAVSVAVGGSVADDVAALAVETRVAGAVGRDLLVVSGDTRVDGPVGRDVRGQGFRMAVDGAVERNVMVRVDGLTLGPDARVGGDVVYESSSDAGVAATAEVGGSLVRQAAITPVLTRAISRMLGVLSLFGFVVAGLAAQWLFRGTSRRAVEAAGEHPVRSALIGTGMLVGPPILALPLFLTLVGIPVALALLILWALALFLGPLPAVTHVGTRMLSGSGGIAAGVVVGAVALRGVMWLLPLIALFVYLGFLVVGLGSYGMAAWGLRREHPG